MMSFLRNMLDAHVKPVTHTDVLPADRDDEKEKEIKAAQNDLVHAVINAERRSWEIRQALAGNVLSIVSGDRS